MLLSLEDISYDFRATSHSMTAGSVHRASWQVYRFTRGVSYRSFQRDYHWSLCIYGYPFGPYTSIHTQFAGYTGGLAYSDYKGPVGIFLSTGMHAKPIPGSRLIGSPWDFHHWTPGKKSHRIDYLLGPFSILVSKVIFQNGVLRHVDPTLAYLCGSCLAFHISLFWSLEACLHIIMPCGFYLAFYYYVVSLCTWTP